MILCIKTADGKLVRLAEKVQTRKDLAEMYGSTFTLDGKSDYTYHVKDVYAAPSTDTTVGWGIFAIFFTGVATKSAIASIISSFVVMAFAKVYFWLDKRAVKHFNNSNWF